MQRQITLNTRVVAFAAALAAGLTAMASTNAFGDAASTTTLTSTPNPSVVGETVTLKAIVGSAGAPTGTVTFTDGTTALGNATVDTIGVGQPIAGGAAHTCALTGTGSVKCWGWLRYGQLGHGVSWGTCTDCNPFPTDVTEVTGAVAIVAGAHHACALTSAGGVKCWGHNQFGQLGSTANNNTQNPNRTPLDVTDLASGVVAITAGDYHTCALTSAGGVKCWGYNHAGQLGSTVNNTTVNPNPIPLDVTGLGSGVVAIAAGNNHTCALTGTGGVKCWGDNYFGQLGSTANNTTSNPNPIPLDVTDLGSGVAAIAAGGSHSCALTSAGGVKCWGYNYYGQLGSTTNNTTGNPNPIPLDVTSLSSGVSALDAGSAHTCALTSAGGVKCWGMNQYGQLGNPTNVGDNGPDPYVTPTPTPLDVTGLGSGVVAITAGWNHTCTLTSAGAGKCWGLNHDGQLGKTTNVRFLVANATPSDVSNLTAMVFGKATLDTAALAVGAHSLTAEYSGDVDHDPSISGPLTQAVQRIPTSVALDTSLNPSAFGQPVTFTAAVSADSGTPEGTVVFLKGGSSIGARPVVGGVATLDTTKLPAGTHSITARYQRSGAYNPSTSPAVSQVVNQGATVTTLTARPAAAVPGAPVRLVAWVDAVAPAAGTPTGTVMFMSGAMTLGTTALVNGRAILMVDELGIGSHSITASYAGNANFTASSSSTNVVTVSPLIGSALNVMPNPSQATMEKGSPAIGRLADGGFVIAWQQQSTTRGFDILARRYQANGKPAGGPFLVNAAHSRRNDQLQASASGLDDGGFVVVWASNHLPQFGSDIYGQRYDAAGLAVGGPVRVNTVQSGDQNEPVIAALSDGGFVVVWTSAGQDGSGLGVYGQRYDPAGAPVGGEFLVNTTVEGEQHQPAVAALTGGGFVVTWTSNQHPAQGDQIHGQRYDTDGAMTGVEFLLNGGTAGNQRRSTVSGLHGGGFAVTWDTESAQGLQAKGVVYGPAGEVVVGEFLINTTVTGDQFESSIAGLPDGGFVVVWTSSEQDGDGNGVFGQAYDATGSPAGDEFQVNAATAGDQEHPRVIGLAGGRFVAVWHSENAGQHSIMAQRLQVQGLGGVVGTSDKLRSAQRGLRRRLVARDDLALAEMHRQDTAAAKLAPCEKRRTPTADGAAPATPADRPGDAQRAELWKRLPQSAIRIDDQQRHSERLRPGVPFGDDVGCIGSSVERQ